MRVLVVNHGYPMRFNAGSEIYTENLVHSLLARGITVQVFSRQENPFEPEYALDCEERGIKTGEKYLIHLVNVPRQKDRYQSDGLDLRFRRIVKDFGPDVIHFNHLNHLSLGLLEEAHKAGCPIVYTLHDFWLNCPRGQFLQINYGDKESYKLCDGQDDEKCAINCYSRYYTGLNLERDIDYWTKWVYSRRMRIKSLLEVVDMFIAPSPSLMKRMQKDLEIPEEKIKLVDYGFDLDRLKGRERSSTAGKEVTFGYIGTHIVAKGIHHLLEAFSMLNGLPKLKIFGRARAETTPYLKSLYESERIIWMPEYKNDEIVKEVFNQIDVIVVPSIWNENSPLVIHEAQQVRIPVITADAGGMADYVQHDVNGLLFKHRDVESLREQMQLLVDKPELIQKLGSKGYLKSKTRDVPSLEEHSEEIIEIYNELLRRRKMDERTLENHF